MPKTGLTFIIFLIVLVVMENEQKQYELICILEPHLEGADLENFKKDLEKIATDNNGKIEHFMETEKRELAYPINKQNQGIYVASHLEFNESGNINEFLKTLKSNKLVLRQMITILEAPQEQTEKPKIIRKPRIRKEENEVSRSKEEKMNLEEIDKKLDELVGL
jgi:ribosomal protein S6